MAETPREDFMKGVVCGIRTGLAIVMLGAPLLLAEAASAQTTGTILGRVLGADGSPLGSATITLLHPRLQSGSDASGEFRITGVPVGRHALEIRYLGYRTDTVSVSVDAAAASLVNVVLGLSPLAVDGITVEGERAAQFRAINEQRVALAVKNIIAADEIGKLPDQNVAEAVRRAAGVSVQTSRGEGRFVSIRGVAPRLNNVTLNGTTLASTAESRATALDLLPASMVSGVEITKSNTPDMDGNAVGGTINIRTITAFDRADPFLFASFEGLFHDQQVDYGDRRMPFEATFTGGRRFGSAQQFGLVLSGSFSRRDFTASVLDPDGWEEVNGSIFPEELELQVEDNQRDRFGVNANLDWRPSDTFALYLRTLFTRTNEKAFNSEYEFGFQGDLLEQTEFTGRYTAGSAELDLSNSEETESLLGFSLGGQRRFGSLTWSIDGTFTRGLLDEEGPDATFETDGDLEHRLSSRFDVTNYFFEIFPDDEAFISDPANYPVRSVDLQYQTNTENTWLASTDLRFDARLGSAPALFKIGAKFQRRDKVIDDYELQYLPTGGTTLAPFHLPNTGTVQGGSAAFVHGDVLRWRDFVLSNIRDPSLFDLDETESALEAVLSDSDNLERILAGYVMGQAQFGRLTALAGARIERTTTESRRYEVVFDEDTDEVLTTDRTFDRSYTNVLPAVILKLDASDRVVLRGAFTNSLGRADYEELAGYREIAYELTGTPGVYEGSVSEGNPDLKPHRAMNLDLFAEYYVPTGGLFSVGGFYKRIDHPIYEWSIEERDFEFEGRFYEEIEFEQDRNADAGTIRGVEISYQQPLTFLPSPLNGLGITANAAFIDSETRIPGREDEDLPFFGQSDRVFTLIPYFQRGGLELRAAWSFQSPWLTDVGDAAFEDRYGDSRGTLDLWAGFGLSHGRYRVFAEARNVTNAAEVGYQGIDSRYDVHTLTGRTFTLGISTNVR
jgi:TonB-dependent receptor